MGIFNLFAKRVKHTNHTASNGTIAPLQNENVDIIMGRKPNTHNTLLFYRKQWAGKGDSGVDWIILKYWLGNCLVSFKSANAGYGEPLPSSKNIKQKNCSIPYDEIIRWDYKKFFDFVAREFAIVLSTDSCITEDEYNCWLEKLRLLSCVVDKIYKFNNGYADRACCVFYNNQKYFFYLKELGNNKGYCMGQEVYEIDQYIYARFENEQLDRATLSNHILDLPHGDQDWLESINFIDSLVTYISDHKICENDQHHFTDLKHFTGGSECRCKKCGLVVKFNRGWPDRIEPSEMEEFIQKYKGSNFDF